MHLSFYNFKHFHQCALDIHGGIFAVLGNNGSGKSTLCEALSIVMNASNPHLTRWEEKCTLTPDDTPSEWALRLQLDTTLFEVLYHTSSRGPKWYIDGHSTTRAKYEEQMPYRALWITSDHLRIISGEPSVRRNFLDDILVLAIPGYDAILRDYHTALTSRNKVIQSIFDGKAQKSDLASWDILLARYAVQITHHRREFFVWLTAQELFTDEHMRIELVERHPLHDTMESTFLALLDTYRERDLVVGRTTVGPHLDEISFQTLVGKSWHPTRAVLSRGENKLLLLRFIRKCGDYIREHSQKTPYFLLDDVLSELDGNHITELITLFTGSMMILTTQPNHAEGLASTLVRSGVVLDKIASFDCPQRANT